jgi:hypothetical protein
MLRCTIHLRAYGGSTPDDNSTICRANKPTVARQGSRSLAAQRRNRTGSAIFYSPLHAQPAPKSAALAYNERFFCSVELVGKNVLF